MATSIQNPSNTNIIVNEWTNVYNSAPVGGFSGTVRIVVEVGSGTIKLANSSTGVTAITQGYGDLYGGSAKSIAFEGSQTQVNAALLSLQAFNNDANQLANLKISAVKAGSAYNPDNGHYYQAIYSSGGIGWLDAKAAAASAPLKFNGLQGYLATITSAKENEFILNKLPADAWIGATDKDQEGHWKWDTGPEAGQEFWYWDGSKGVTVSSRYHNWNSNEPNNSASHSGSPEGEDYGQFYVSGGSPGKWNDLPGAGAASGKLKYYVVEYGGMGSDAPTEAAASSSSTLTVQARPVITSNDGGATASINYAENGTAAVTIVTATDADSGDTKSYSISGTDVDDFSINSSTGALTFKSSPNYEVPTDSDGNNSYVVTVTVRDGANLTDSQTLTVNVTNANDVPTTTGALPASIAVNEDETVNVDLSAISISDEDPSDTVTIKLAASEGTLAATGADGVTVVGSGSNTLTLTGTPAAVSAYLDTATHIQYTGALNDNGSPAATIAVSYKDSTMSSFLTLGSAIAVNITAVNDAPVIASAGTAATLPGIHEDQSSATNAGATVNSLFAPRFTDVDSGAKMSGIVVVGDASTATQGTWQYSTDSGANWYAIGTVSTTAGLVLSNSTANGSATQLRFAPAQDWNGTPGALTVKLLDNTQASFTSGATQVTLDTTTNPASSAASTNAVNLTTSVAAVNDLPEITSAAGAASLTETADWDSSVTASGALTGTLEASDVEDGTGVTYGIRGGTSNAVAGTVTKAGFFGTLVLNTGTKEWTYVPGNFTAINALNDGQTATDVFEFSITDAAGATARQALTITYTGTNDTPLVKAGANPIPDQKFNGTGSWSYQIPADIFTDADGTNLTYTVQVVDDSGNVIDTITNATGTDANKPSNWLIFNEDSRTLSGEPTATAPLPLNIKITASDGGTNVVTDTFTVTLVQPNSADNPAPGAVTAPTPAATFPGLAIAGDAAYTENAAPKALAPALAIADSDSLTLASATVTISAGKVDGDLLAFNNDNATNFGNILATYNATDGQLMLASASSSATLAQWEAALKAVTFYSSSDNPGTNRTVSWQVNDGANPSDIGTTSIVVTPVNDAPVATKLSDVTHASNALWELDVDGTDNNLFTDAEAETITYSATLADGSDLPSWLSFDATTHTFSGNPPAGLPSLNLKVIGTDASNAEIFTTFTLNLTSPTSGGAAANTTGTVSISGSTTLGAELIAATSDGDGLTGTVTYQWQKSSDGNTWIDIGGERAQGSAFTITQAESKQQLRVQAFYNDAGGFAEAPVSNALTIPALNLKGTVTVNGSPLPGQTLVASLSDGNGIVGVTPTYTWYRGDTSGAQTTVVGGNFSAYTLSNDDGGKFITVRVTYTDNEGTTENVTGSSSQIQLGAEPPKAVNDTGTATEAGGLNNATAGSNASGNVLGNDTDLNTSDTKTVTGLRTGNVEGLGDGAVLVDGAYTLEGTYGTLSITASTGAYTYTVHQDAANVQALTAGQTATDVFNYTVADGTQLSDVGLLTITLTGADDALVVSNLPATFTVTEDVTMAIDFGNSFNLSDPDFPGAATVTLKASKGTLSGASALDVTVSDSGTGALTLVGTLGNISTWLKTIGSLQYTSALNDSGTPGATLTLKSGGITLGTASIHITPVNDAPVISSNGGDAPTPIDYEENGTTAVTTVTATDPDSGDTQTFSISGGDDADLFRINAGTGALTFRNSPNYEVPADADNNNSYIVTVKVADAAGLTDEQTLTINVTDDTSADDPIETGGAGSETITAPADNAKINVTGSGTTTITNPAGNLTIANSGSGTVVVEGLNPGATVNTSGTGATQISDPEGSLTVANSGTGTVTVDGLNTDSVLSTTGSGPTAVTNPDGNLSVANNGTGTVTVGGLNSGASLTANGTGPTQVNDPEGHLTVNNSGSGVVTVDGLNTGSVLTTSGSGPTAVTNPDGNLEVANNGAGTVTVSGLNPGASLTASGTGPTQVNDPEGSLSINNNNSSGTVTVNGLNTGSVLTTTGSGSTTVANPDGNLSVANNGTGTVTVNGLNPNASLTASGSGPTLIENPDASLIVANSGTGTVTVNGLNTGGVLTTTGSGPTAVTNPDGSLAVANNGTGIVTVNGLNPNASLTANGTGPTLVNDPEGNLSVSNSGSGTVTVAGLNDGAVLNSNGTGPVRVTDPDDDVSVVNNGSGTVSVDGMKAGAVLSSSGTGPVTISNPEGNLRLANTGTGTVTVEDLKPSATLTTTGTQPILVDLSHLSSGQTITIDNDGSGVVNLVNVPEGVIVLTTGSNGSGGINYAPTISGVPVTAQGVTVGSTASLADFTVADKDTRQSLTVTLTATNGTIGGLTDADSTKAGIQLNGTASDINTALVAATFTAAGASSANVAISVSDGITATTASYGLTASNPSAPDPVPTQAPTPAPTPVPTPAPTIETIDGTQVESGTVVKPDGSLTESVTIAPVSDTRVEDGTTANDDLADIVLFWGESTRTQQATTVSLPTGVGLTTEGSRAPVVDRTAASALTELVQLIEDNTTDADTTKVKMLAGGESFLNALSTQSTETLVVNKVTLTVANDFVNTKPAPILITGTSTPVTTTTGTTGAPVEALVIDTRSLPKGSVLNLQNIEFAVIVGDDVQVTGGEGANIVFAGAGSQTLILGEGDDELHGGDDNDIVGSKGGNDQLFGDAGDDVLFGGTGNDALTGGTGIDIALFKYALNEYQIRQNSDGSWTVSHSIEGTDTLKEIEFAEFADQTISLAGNNQWLNVLFQQNINLF